MKVEALDENITVQRPGIRAEGPYDPPLAWRPRIDLGRTLGKNLSDGLVKPMQELAKSVTETSSKVCKPKTYDEAVNDLINRNRWREAINKEL